jgi:hypothetical protein
MQFVCQYLRTCKDFAIFIKESAKAGVTTARKSRLESKICLFAGGMESALACPLVISIRRIWSMISPYLEKDTQL